MTPTSRAAAVGVAVTISLGALCPLLLAQASAPATRPAPLFKEDWKLPPHQGAPNDENMRFTPAVVTNPNLEARLYGTHSSVIRAAEHEGRVDPTARSSPVLAASPPTANSSRSRSRSVT
jgi:hypothetical protein